MPCGHSGPTAPGVTPTRAAELYVRPCDRRVSLVETNPLQPRIPMSRRRRRRSPISEILADAAYIGNRASWRTSIVIGAILFVLCYWLVPALIHTYIASQPSSKLTPLLDQVVGRRLHLFKWLAVALGLLFAYFAARSYSRQRPHTRTGERSVGFFARLLARILS